MNCEMEYLKERIQDLKDMALFTAIGYYRAEIRGDPYIFQYEQDLNALEENLRYAKIELKDFEIELLESA